MADGAEAGAAERGGLGQPGRGGAAHRAVQHAEGLHAGRVRQHHRRGQDSHGGAQVSTYSTYV